MSSRVLVLDTGKALFDAARDRLASDREFLSVTAGVEVPSFRSEPRTFAAIDALMGRTPFAHVVATSESNMALAGRLRSRYGLSGLDAEDAVVATNKWRMKQAVAPVHCVAAGWLSGAFLERRGARPDEVVLKPLSSSSARGVRRMALADADAELRRTGELCLVEEALDVAHELHCDGVVADGRLAWVVVSAYDRPVLVSHGTRASVHLPPNDPRVESASRSAAVVVEALPIDAGVFHLELLEVEGELVFGEIGLRPAGTGIAESIARCFGVDIWRQFVAAQVGIAVDTTQPVRRHSALSGVVMARPALDGAAPLGPDAAASLTAVTGLAAGNLAPGREPDDMCSYYYLAFFDGLDDGGVQRLVADVGRADPGARR